MQPGSLACACSPILTSTRKPRRNGTPRSSIQIRSTTMMKSWCGPTASEWPAASAMWVRTQPIRRPTRKIQNGKISTPMRAPSTSAGIGSSRIKLTPRTSVISCSMPRSPGRWIRRSFQQIILSIRAMNAIYNIGSRLQAALKTGEEKLAAGEEDNKQFNEFVAAETPLTQFHKSPGQVFAPHVLKDGADSTGALGSFNRVFVNIGLFSEESLQHFNPIIGGKAVSPVSIKTGRANSAYWQATEAQTPNTALFFTATSKPDLLKNAPGGEKYLTAGAATLARGKEVFAERCARC